jgi:hypothetical protein
MSQDTPRTGARHPLSHPISVPAGHVLTDIADILSVLPTLTGTEPADSLCILATDPSQIITLPLLTRLPEMPEDLPALITEIVHVLTTQPAVHAVLLIGYGPSQQVTTVIAAACGALAATSITVLDAVRAEPGRYWPYLDPDPNRRVEGIAYTPHTSTAASAGPADAPPPSPDPDVEPER